MLRRVFNLLLLIVLLVTPAWAQSNGTVAITVTNVATSITTDRSCFSILIRENSASPTAIFSITPTRSSTAIVFAAGGGYEFVAPGGFPFPAGWTVGTIVATTAGPFNFIAMESAIGSSKSLIIQKSGVSSPREPKLNFTGTAVTSVVDDPANERTTVTLTAAGGGAGAVLQTNESNTADQTLLDLKDTSSVAFTNPSGGIVSATVKPNSITMAMLASLMGTAPGTKLVTTSLAGDPTANNCAKWVAGGILGDAGAACGSGGGSPTFIGLTDVPANFTGSGLKYVRVNSAATALEFTPNLQTISGGCVILFDNSNVNSFSDCPPASLSVSLIETRPTAVAAGFMRTNATGVRPTNAEISGDCATAIFVITCTKLNGVVYGTAPATNTVPVVTSANTITYETVPVAAGGTGIGVGTSGGVPYFNSATTMASSAALGANLPVIGGGAGVAPSVGTRTGNTTQFATWTGATTAGRCVNTDAGGNLQVTGSDCGSGAGGGNNAALFTATADAIVSNSAAEATIIGTGVGSKTTAANYFAAGTSLLVRSSGYLSTPAVPDAITIKIKAGSTVVGSATFTLPLNLANQVFSVEALVTCRTAGATGTFMLNDIVLTTNSTLTATISAKALNTATVTLDTTGTLAWDVTATWGAAQAGETITGTNFIMLTPGTGIADPGANGILARSSLNTVVARTLTGTTNKVGVTNGDGVAGNPTIDVGTDIVDKTLSNTYAAATVQTPATLNVTESFALQNDNSPTQITGDQNDYNPASCATAGVLRLDTSRMWSLTGLDCSKADGRVLSLVNVGSFPIQLVSESASSIAANRFALNGNNITFLPGSAVFIIYDPVSSRWKLLSLGLLAKVSDPTTNIVVSGEIFGTGANAPWNMAATVSGTAATCQVTAFRQNAASKAIGNLECDTGTTATGRAALSPNALTPSTTIGIPPVLGFFMGGWRIGINALSTAAEEYALRIGFHDGVGAGAAANGCNFLYDRTVSVNWQYQCAGSSARTTETSGTDAGSTAQAVNANEYIWLVVTCNAAWTSCNFFSRVEAATVWTWQGNIADANIPASTENFYPVLKIEKSVGTTQSNLYVASLFLYYATGSC